MVYALKDVTVSRFMSCLFDNEYGDMENWESLYTKYIDLSGLGEEGQLGILVAIHNLKCRLALIDTYVEVHRKVIGMIKMPLVPRVGELSKYGYHPTWTGDVDNFLQQLTLIESKEKRNHAEIKKLEKELRQMQEAKNPQTVSARNSFVTMIVVLEKDGYKIDEEKTNMEKFSLIVRDHSDKVKAANSS